ncbi:MAG: single-stranded-DNA-specific exonuclease RecJ [Candidatus Magasanikbacteria bacterium]|nr:single-stranded-DNA-specific exonuclease RecJ [Candidatus Magasanikbacteria bacterium]
MKKTVWAVKDETEKYDATAMPDVHPVIAQLLWNRGLRTATEAHTFLEPDYERDVHDPFLFRDMHAAVDRLRTAIVAHELIIVHGDYDADGISASAILTHALRTLGANVDGFIPHRELDGYGLRVSTVETLAARGAKILITCDCGISNAVEIARANELGINVIITDHHTIPETLPLAFATLHPKVSGETYPDQTLSGGGVAFKLMQGLMQDPEIQKLMPPNFNAKAFQKWQLDLVAISSVADMVPLVGETRTLVYFGCKVLGKTKRHGLRALLARDKIIVTDAGSSSPITPQIIGFKIAPRINAAGRMDHGKYAFEMLLAETPEEGARLANQLFDNNTDRQKLTESILKEAIVKIKRDGLDQFPSLVVAGEGWPAGLVGLIASRLKEKFYKPTFVIGINEDRIVGSGRSIPEWNMIAAMQTVPQVFTKFGGHPQACGFSLESVAAIQIFADAMHKLADTHVEHIQELIPTITIDTKVTLDSLDWELLGHLEKFEPFGIGNPEPTFLTEHISIVGVQPVGATGKHIRLMVKNGTPQIKKMMGFGMGEFLKELAIGRAMHGVVSVSCNEWNGTRELQYKLQDFRLIE